jgi:hypothetical protein
VLSAGGIAAPASSDLQERAADAVAAFRAFRFEEDAVVATCRNQWRRFRARLQESAQPAVNLDAAVRLRQGPGGRLVVPANGAIEAYNDRPSSFVPGRGCIRVRRPACSFRRVWER